MRRSKQAPAKGKMGVFYTKFRVERFPDMEQGTTVERGLVDTGAEFTWVPAQHLEDLGIERLKAESFTTADGKVIKRNVGFGVVRMDQRFTVDEIIFAQPGDLTLLGSRTLEGLGLIVDARRKRLVAAGPAPAATAIRPATARAMGIIVKGKKTRAVRKKSIRVGGKRKKMRSRQ